MPIETWKDSEGHTHGEVIDGNLHIRQRGRLIEVIPGLGDVRVRSTFPNGKRAEKRLTIPR